jgi:hypothetical protein
LLSDAPVPVLIVVNPVIVVDPFTVNPVNVPRLVILGCAAVCSVPVKLPLNAPAYIVPLAPIPPVTTNEPVVVLELAVLAVSVTALFAVRVVNAPLALVVAPIAMLSIVLDAVGAMVTTLEVTASVAEPPLIVTLPLKEPVVAINGEPSSEITT